MPLRRLVVVNQSMRALRIANGEGRKFSWTPPIEVVRSVAARVLGENNHITLLLKKAAASKEIR